MTQPDVIAPGVNILAAWTSFASPTDLDIDPRRVDFNIISGTSMSCPHVNGLEALPRQAHPDWSPAAIKSALMTTAYNTDNSDGVIHDLANGKESTPFVHGAGHIDPNRSLDPGLQVGDYISFHCTNGYSPLQIAVFVKDLAVDCSGKEMVSPGDLNYPSFSVVFDPHNKVVTYRRTVKNVGSTQAGEISEPNQTRSYSVTFSTVRDPVKASATVAFGSITWKDGVHVVRSSVAFQWTSAGLVSAM
ncbi:hypothetical protein Taro_004068 [Colocasia esculenta]|uniref:Uncharacterized protein n=1 Tax=Colocasia esculenta TaxID=4460 RepID=A0A843TQN3_COLES|nr:hypothetical protein [Colocasia esculenta]